MTTTPDAYLGLHPSHGHLPPLHHDERMPHPEGVLSDAGLFEWEALETAPVLPSVFFMLQPLLQPGRGPLSNAEALGVLQMLKLPSPDEMVRVGQSVSDKAWWTPSHRGPRRAQGGGVPADWTRSRGFTTPDPVDPQAVGEHLEGRGRGEMRTVTRLPEVSTEFALFVRSWNLLMDFLMDAIREKNPNEDLQHLAEQIRHLFGREAAPPAPETPQTGGGGSAAHRYPIGMSQDERLYYLTARNPLDMSAAARSVPPRAGRSVAAGASGLSLQSIRSLDAYVRLRGLLTGSSGLSGIPEEAAADGGGGSMDIRAWLEQGPRAMRAWGKLMGWLDRVLDGPPLAARAQQTRSPVTKMAGFPLSGEPLRQAERDERERARSPPRDLEPGRVWSQAERAPFKAPQQQPETEQRASQQANASYATYAEYRTQTGFVSEVGEPYDERQEIREMGSLHERLAANQAELAERQQRTASSSSMMGTGLEGPVSMGAAASPQDITVAAVLIDQAQPSEEQTAAPSASWLPEDVQRYPIVEERPPSPIMRLKEQIRRDDQQREAQPAPEAPLERPEARASVPDKAAQEEDLLQRHRRRLADDLRDILADEIFCTDETRRAFAYQVALLQAVGDFLGSLMEQTLALRAHQAGAPGDDLLSRERRDWLERDPLSFMADLLPGHLMGPLRTARTLLEAFSDGKSVRPVLDRLARFLVPFTLLGRDYAFRDWTRDMVTFLSDTLGRQSRYLQAREWHVRATGLITRSEALPLRQHNDRFEAAMAEWRSFRGGFSRDPWLTEWASRWSDLMQDWNDWLRVSSGLPASFLDRSAWPARDKGAATNALTLFDWLSFMLVRLPGRAGALLRELPAYLVPYLMARLAALPLPRLEGHGQHLHFWLDEWTLRPLLDPDVRHLPWQVRLYGIGQTALYPRRLAEQRLQARAGGPGAAGSGPAARHVPGLLAVGALMVGSSADWSTEDTRMIQAGESRARAFYLAHPPKPPAVKAAKQGTPPPSGTAWHMHTPRSKPASKQERRRQRDVARRNRIMQRAQQHATPTGAPLSGGLPTAESEQRYVLSIKNMSWQFEHVRFAYRLRSRWFGLGLVKKTVADEGHLRVQLGRELPWTERQEMERDEAAMLTYAHQQSVATTEASRRTKRSVRSLQRRMKRRGARGVSLWLELGTPGAPTALFGRAPGSLPARLLHLHAVKVKVDRVELAVDARHHKAMYGLVLPFMRSVVRRRLERFAEEQVLRTIDRLDRLLVRTLGAAMRPASILFG